MLLVLRDVQEHLDDGSCPRRSAGARTRGCAGSDAATLFGYELLDPDDADVLVVRAVEDPDLAAPGQAACTRQRKSCSKLDLARRLERRHPAGLGVDRRRASDRAVLARVSSPWRTSRTNACPRPRADPGGCVAPPGGPPCEPFELLLPEPEPRRRIPFGEPRRLARLDEDLVEDPHASGRSGTRSACARTRTFRSARRPGASRGREPCRPRPRAHGRCAPASHVGSDPAGVHRVDEDAVGTELGRQVADEGVHRRLRDPVGHVPARHPLVERARPRRDDDDPSPAGRSAAAAAPGSGRRARAG